MIIEFLGIFIILYIGIGDFVFYMGVKIFYFCIGVLIYFYVFNISNIWMND